MATHASLKNHSKNHGLGATFRFVDVEQFLAISRGQSLAKKRLASGSQIRMSRRNLIRNEFFPKDRKCVTHFQ